MKLARSKLIDESKTSYNSVENLCYGLNKNKNDLIEFKFVFE